ncbi:type I secretion system permease/ATPase [Ramlibacter sp. 2FC]|uniref:type I secretion system permease/ATPase n=1 Tax=Ramlibacter sp. 2FC TaxID=2502188 RepID=UPI0010FA3C97|nr:type I secretion system permease/ATPase [Ramlibacter sp. 2FC]
MSSRKPVSELRDAVLALRPQLVRATWFSLGSSLLLLMPTLYMLEVYGRVLDSRSAMTLAMLTLLVLAALLVMGVLDWARAEVMREASLRLDQRLSARIFDAIFEASLKRVPGSSAQPMSDFRTLREFLYAPVLLALLESPAALVLMVLLFAMDAVLGWAALAGAIVQTLLAWMTERSTQPPLTAANRSAIAAQQYADGSLRNAQVIESMGMLRDIHSRWMDKHQESLAQQAQASDAAGGYQALSRMLQLMMGSVLLGLGAWLLLRADLPGGGGMIIVASVLGGRLLAPLVQIVSQWRVVVNARDAWARLEPLLAQLPPRPETMPLPPPRGQLSVENLVAGAPGSTTPILKGLHFALRPGEVLAVVGPSASGKTTLARLLVGVWPAASGKVRLDGADVFSWNKAELGPYMGYLPQEVALLDGTLAENIARFGEVDMAKVEAAARAVELHDFIMALPQGYDSPVGREGAILSGGQRQRVALARALYGEPVFVVLDEPNASLDEAGDAALAHAIERRKAQGTSFVVVTQRTSVLGVADKMLVLRDGTQQLFGPRDEVLAGLAKAVQQTQKLPQPGRPAEAAASASELAPS